ncbi:MAG: hypothetical protein ACKOXO_12665 [Cyanobium sp.]
MSRKTSVDGAGKEAGTQLARARSLGVTVLDAAGPRAAGLRAALHRPLS